MIRKATSSNRALFTLAGLLAGLVLVVTPASGQELSLDGDPDRPIIDSELSTALSFTTVEGVDLVSPRADGPPALVFSVGKQKVRPAPGIYKTSDGNALRVSKYGQIVELDGGREASGFRVASVDELAVRAGWDRPRIVFYDARKQSVGLPDGRYVNEDGIVMTVSKGTVIGYGSGR